MPTIASEELPGIIVFMHGLGIGPEARGVVDAHLTKHMSRIPLLDETINGKFNIACKNSV